MADWYAWHDDYRTPGTSLACGFELVWLSEKDQGYGVGVGAHRFAGVRMFTFLR